MRAGDQAAAREGAASAAEALASIRAAARAAPRSAPWGYVPCEVPSVLRAPGSGLPSPVRSDRHHRPVAPRLRAGVLLPGATIVKGGNRGLPERVRCFYDLYVMKGLEAQEPPVSILRGFLEPLELGKDSSHCPSRLAGSGRCTSFETSHRLGRARGGSGHSGRYRWPSSRFVTMLSARAAPRPDQVCTSRPTHSEHLSGAKRHVR